jgi:hypothetical protein
VNAKFSTSVGQSFPENLTTFSIHFSHSDVSFMAPRNTGAQRSSRVSSFRIKITMSIAQVKHNMDLTWVRYFDSYETAFRRGVWNQEMSSRFLPLTPSCRRTQGCNGHPNFGWWVES